MVVLLLAAAAAGIDFGDKLINKPDRIEGEIIQIYNHSIRILYHYQNQNIA